MLWFFLVDDAYGDLHDGTQAHRLCEQLTHAIFEPRLPRPPLMNHCPPGHVHEKQPLIIAVGLEFWQELQQSCASPSQAARFRSEFCKHLEQQAAEVVFREKYTRSGSKLPGLEEYILMRRVTSGFGLCVTMLEYDVGIELDLENLENPQLRELHDAITDLACWINDILSFPKELAHGELLNLLPVLHMHRKFAMNAAEEGRSTDEEVPFAEAVSEAWCMIEAREEECAALAQALMQRHESSPKFCKYVETACGIGTGVWAWSVQSARYKVPPKNDTSDGQTLRPSHTMASLGPPNLQRTGVQGMACRHPLQRAGVQHYKRPSVANIGLPLTHFKVAHPSSINTMALKKPSCPQSRPPPTSLPLVAITLLLSLSPTSFGTVQVSNSYTTCSQTCGLASFL
ncbi:hypothetical protein GOP47_0019328 [Adiantum capillus-veneris]|uniref:Terpene synthase n=1 Tax=Adiantum capillus-veneris TaxID=13818 RepID=A0A9D4UG20_ADICA|nr:hypothetical protein GOP47_0019328 [Adiantum capillus-veneris]